MRYFTCNEMDTCNLEKVLFAMEFILGNLKFLNGNMYK